MISYMENSSKCENCGDSHEGSYGSGRFCSLHCARSYPTKKNRDKINRKISESLTRHEKNFCRVCGKEITRRNNSKLCRSCKPHYKRYENDYFYLRDYRRKIKEKFVLYKGGKCSICGYDKAMRALEFHHEDPSKKENGIFYHVKWEESRKELDKCILVCSNCHREIHEEMDRRRRLTQVSEHFIDEDISDSIPSLPNS